jgi:hypothetical protein
MLCKSAALALLDVKNRNLTFSLVLAAYLRTQGQDNSWEVF